MLIKYKMNFQELLANKQLIKHFTDYLDEQRPKRKTSTNANYALRLQGVVKKLSFTVPEDFSKYDEIIESLKDRPVTTRANTITAVMDYLDILDAEKHKQVIKDFKKIRDINLTIYQKNHSQTAYTATQKSNVISYDELLSYYELIKDIVKQKKYEESEIKWQTSLGAASFPAIDYLNARLLLRLYLMHPSRNEYADLVMIKVKDFKKIEHPMKNYLVFSDRTPCFLSINIYKTMDKYGEKRIPIKDKELIKWIRFHKNKFGYQEQMFYQQNGVGYNPLKMTQVLTVLSKRHLNKSISSTMMYKIIIKELSDKYNKALDEYDIENIEKYQEDLRNFAKTRGHTLGTQQAIYSDN